MPNEKRQLTRNSNSSASDELLILIERLSVKGQDLKSAVTRGRLRAIRDPLCYQGFQLRLLPWLLMFARVWLGSWGAGGLSWASRGLRWSMTDTSLHSYHSYLSSPNGPKKDSPFSRTAWKVSSTLFGLSAWAVLMELGFVDACLKERHNLLAS